jgi:hypothetical protein
MFPTRAILFGGAKSNVEVEAHKQTEYPSAHIRRIRKMSQTFAEVVEDVRQLSPAEKEELQEIIKMSLVEERRREILENADAGMEEMRRGELKSFSNIDDLIHSL